MRDLETGSEWSHLLGKAMHGELQGEVLQPVVSEMVTWEAWLDKYPQSTVLNMSRTDHSYTREFYRQAPQRFVLGLRVQGKAYAISMVELQESNLAQFEIEGVPMLAYWDPVGSGIFVYDRRIAGQTLMFDLKQDSDKPGLREQHSNGIWDPATGICISGPLQGETLQQQVGIMSFRTAWENFHPDSIDVVLAAVANDNEFP